MGPAGLAGGLEEASWDSAAAGPPGPSAAVSTRGQLPAQRGPECCHPDRGSLPRVLWTSPQPIPSLAGHAPPGGDPGTTRGQPGGGDTLPGPVHREAAAQWARHQDRVPRHPLHQVTGRLGRLGSARGGRGPSWSMASWCLWARWRPTLAPSVPWSLAAGSPSEGGEGPRRPHLTFSWPGPINRHPQGQCPCEASSASGAPGTLGAVGPGSGVGTALCPAGSWAPRGPGPAAHQQHWPSRDTLPQPVLGPQVGGQAGRPPGPEHVAEGAAACAAAERASQQPGQRALPRHAEPAAGGPWGAGGWAGPGPARARSDRVRRGARQYTVCRTCTPLALGSPAPWTGRAPQSLWPYGRGPAPSPAGHGQPLWGMGGATTPTPPPRCERPMSADPQEDRVRPAEPHPRL